MRAAPARAGRLPGRLDDGPRDAAAIWDTPPGGYRKRNPEDYDRTLCLLPRDVVDFVLATQPKEWKKLEQHHGAGVREQFLKRLAAEIERRGALDVLRRGLKDSGWKFRLAYFRPASGLNEETRRMHAANLFAVGRQVHYSTRNHKSLDLVLFLNGIPIFTAELKNPLSGQDVEDAIRQYKTDREPLLKYGRCLAHFAVDPDLVYVTTQLAGPRTRFLPFNQGKFGGAGNPPVPPTRRGYATGYLWDEAWARDRVLDLVRQFIHEVEEEDDKGKKTGRRFLIFPRYQQLDCVRRLVTDARATGAGQRYLIQHSAGSGKSFTIAWLAHQLATLHDAADRRGFDSIVVITDRRVLDRQLQSTMRQCEQTLGVVENIDTTSRQLKDALESGKTIIVTTMQKFPVIAKEIGELPGKRFALIVDEAHSSQSGESAKSLKAVLSSGSLEAAEAEEAGAATPEEELESVVLAEMEKRGRLPNRSSFAFTATPKPKALELFGTRRPDGKFAPLHLYSMRQAIEEGFILDVLANYATYKAYWRLLKKVEHVIQGIVDSNFDLYKRITDDRVFGEAIKNFLFDQYLRAHRNAEELIKAGKSKSLEFKSALRWSLEDARQDDKGVTHAVLKTIAAFLNTEDGDLLIGVADDGSIVGIEKDRLENDDKFMRHLAQVARNALGDRAGSCIDPRTQIVQGKTVCVVGCQRSPEPVFLKWKGLEAAPEGDFFVRSGPGTVKLPPDSARDYIRTRFGALGA